MRSVTGIKTDEKGRYVEVVDDTKVYDFDPSCAECGRRRSEFVCDICTTQLCDSCLNSHPCVLKKVHAGVSMALPIQRQWSGRLLTSARSAGILWSLSRSLPDESLKATGWPEDLNKRWLLKAPAEVLAVWAGLSLCFGFEQDDVDLPRAGGRLMGFNVNRELVAQLLQELKPSGTLRVGLADFLLVGADSTSRTALSGVVFEEDIDDPPWMGIVLPFQERDGDKPDEWPVFDGNIEGVVEI